MKMNVTRRLVIILVIQEVIILWFTGAVVVSLGAWFTGARAKMFLPLVVVLFGALEKLYSYIQEKSVPKFLLPAQKYPGENTEQRVRKRDNHRALLKDVSLYTVWFLLTLAAVWKAAEGGD